MYCILFFQRKPIDTLNSFTTGNYLHQLNATFLFANCVDLCLLMEDKSAVIKDVSSAKFSESFAALGVLIEFIFFTFSPFIYLLLVNQGCSMFLLEFWMDYTLRFVMDHVEVTCMLIMSWLLHLKYSCGNYIFWTGIITLLVAFVTDLCWLHFFTFVMQLYSFYSIRYIDIYITIYIYIYIYIYIFIYIYH